MKHRIHALQIKREHDLTADQYAALNGLSKVKLAVKYHGSRHNWDYKASYRIIRLIKWVQRVEPSYNPYSFLQVI